MKVLSSLWMVALLSLSLAAAGTDLIEAVQRGDQEGVRSLLEQQADVNASQPDGATALHWAAHRDDLETAQLLIGAGADVNAVNDYGVTVLSLASTNGSPGMVERLLGAGADPNAAHDSRPQRQRGIGNGSAGSRSQGECQRKTPGPDGFDVGGCGESLRGRPGVD